MRGEIYIQTKKIFKKYEVKLEVEAILKSLFCALIIAFIANIITNLICYLANEDVLIISIGISLGLVVIFTPIFYYKKFIPTDAKTAARVDCLGLEERLITMVELKESETYIAKVQREDALAKLAKVNTNLKMKFVKTQIIAVIVLLLVSGGATTAGYLSRQGVLPTVDDLFEEEKRDEIYNVVYTIQGQGGQILGNADQFVVYGSDATPVLAVADEGFVFVEWSDGFTNPYRNDINIVENIGYVATFQQIGEPSEDSEPSDDPGEPSDKPSDPNEDGAPQPGDGDGDGQGEGGDKDNSANQIIDGETYYGDEYDSAYDDAKGDMEGELPPGYNDVVGDYFDTIK